jgi:hypothetical protein
VRCDSAPGFRALLNDEILHSLVFQIDLGRVKNINKNPVAEQAIRELELEILKVQPDPGPIAPIVLVKDTTALNSRFGLEVCQRERCGSSRTNTATSNSPSATAM